jgi:hypothetical protein
MTQCDGKDAKPNDAFGKGCDFCKGLSLIYSGKGWVRHEANKSNSGR